MESTILIETTILFKLYYTMVQIDVARTMYMFCLW